MRDWQAGGEQHANTQIVDKGGRVPAHWIEWLEVEGDHDGTYKNKRGELLQEGGAGN